MSPYSPRAHQIASTIVAHDLAGCHSSEALAEGVDRLLTDLYVLLADVIGPMGFRAILIRAIHLTRPVVSWLDRTELVLEERLRWDGLTDIMEQEGHAEIRTATEFLVGHILTLLFSFIGENLTCRLLRRSWPDLLDSERS